MNGHISEKLITSVLSETASQDDVQKLNDHIRICPSCRHHYDVLSRIFQPTGEIEGPSDTVRKNILTSWAEADRKEKEKKAQPRFLFAMAASAAAVFVVLTSGIILWKMTAGLSSPAYVLNRLDGTVYEGATSVDKSAEIRNASSIRTAAASSASLTKNNSFNLTIAPSTSLIFTPEKKGNDAIAVLQEGSITATSHNAHQYRIEARHYCISPQGTAFTVSLNREIISVSVREGSVSILDKQTNSSVSLLEGKEWNSSSLIIRSTPEPDAQNITVPLPRSDFKAAGAVIEDFNSGEPQTDNSRKKEERMKRSEKKDIENEKNEIRKEQAELKKEKRSNSKERKRNQ